MESSPEIFGGVDYTLAFCWIAGGVAFLFILIVLGDFVRQRRKFRHLSTPSRAAAPAKGLLDFLLKPWLTAKVPARRRRK